MAQARELKNITDLCDRGSRAHCVRPEAAAPARPMDRQDVLRVQERRPRHGRWLQGGDGDEERRGRRDDCTPHGAGAGSAPGQAESPTPSDLSVSQGSCRGLSHRLRSRESADARFCNKCGIRLPAISQPGTGGEFLDHLGELRRRLIVSALAILAASAACYFLSDWLLRIMLLPSGGLRLRAFALMDGLIIRLRLSLYAGIVAAFPVWAWQAARFVSPGLLPKRSGASGHLSPRRSSCSRPAPCSATTSWA